MKALTSNIIEVEDNWEAANDWFCREKLSDGLPIVPPTPERVTRMLEGTGRDPQEVIGILPPKWAPASIEKLAINAVMAGCLPEYLPVIITAVEAICEPRFNLYGVQQPPATSVRRCFSTVRSGPRSTSIATPAYSVLVFERTRLSAGRFD